MPEPEAVFMTHEPSLTLEEKRSFLLQPDYLLSLQFLDTCRRKSYLEPERVLMLAVLEDIL